MAYNKKPEYNSDLYTEDVLNVYKSLRNLRESQYDNILTNVKKIKQAGSWLDVGCSIGWFLAKIKNQGYMVYGLEPSRNAFSLAKKVAGVTVYNDLFPSKKIAGKRFDIISFMDVFEHMPDPKSIIPQIKRVISDDGILILKLPNSRSLLYRYIKLVYRLTCGAISGPMNREWQVDFDSPHYFYYNRLNICYLFEGSGFKPEAYFELDDLDIDGFTERFPELKNANIFKRFFYIATLRAISLLSNLLNVKDSFVLILARAD